MKKNVETNNTFKCVNQIMSTYDILPFMIVVKIETNLKKICTNLWTQSLLAFSFTFSNKACHWWVRIFVSFLSWRTKPYISDYDGIIYWRQKYFDVTIQAINVGTSMAEVLYPLFRRLKLYKSKNIIRISFCSGYRLKCGKRRFYKLWNSCYGRYHSRSVCFGRLQKQHIFVVYRSGRSKLCFRQNNIIFHLKTKEFIC